MVRCGIVFNKIHTIHYLYRYFKQMYILKHCFQRNLSGIWNISFNFKICWSTAIWHTMPKVDQQDLVLLVTALKILYSRKQIIIFPLMDEITLDLSILPTVCWLVNNVRTELLLVICSMQKQFFHNIQSLLKPIKATCKQQKP